MMTSWQFVRPGTHSGTSIDSRFASDIFSGHGVDSRLDSGVFAMPEICYASARRNDCGAIA